MLSVLRSNGIRDDITVQYQDQQPIIQRRVSPLWSLFNPFHEIGSRLNNLAHKLFPRRKVMLLERIVDKLPDNLQGTGKTKCMLGMRSHPLSVKDSDGE